MSFGVMPRHRLHKTRFSEILICSTNYKTNQKKIDLTVIKLLKIFDLSNLGTCAPSMKTDQLKNLKFATFYKALRP